jgi:hypothetical protein
VRTGDHSETLCADECVCMSCASLSPSTLCSCPDFVLVPSCLIRFQPRSSRAALLRRGELSIIDCISELGIYSAFVG